MDDEIQLTKSDLSKFHPAARCRSCKAVTWTVSIDAGLKKVRPQHKVGCPKPRGRLDLLENIPLSMRDSVFNGRLLTPLRDEEVAEIAEWMSELSNQER